MTKQRVIEISGIALAAVLLFLGGYGLGRYKTPEKVVIQEKVKIQEVEKQVVVTQVKTEVKTVRVVDKDLNIHKVTITEKRPDGTVVTQEIMDNKSQIDIGVHAEVGQVLTNTQTKETVRVEEKVNTKVVQAAKPQWRAGVGVGYSIPGLWGNHTPFNLVPMQDVVAQASIERRILGPISLGLWGTSTGTAGVSAHLEW